MSGSPSPDDRLAARVRELLDRQVDGVLPIVRAGDPVLRTVASRYTGELPHGLLRALVDAMRRTMHAAPGVGLAAPQVGLSLALAVIEDPGATDPQTAAGRERVPVPFRVLVNPAYRATGDRRVTFYEGCLSVPGWVAARARHRTVALRACTIDGEPVEEELVGWPARIVQHETDHLLGELYLDGAELRSLSHESLAGRWTADARPRAAAEALGFPLTDGRDPVRTPPPAQGAPDHTPSI